MRRKNWLRAACRKSHGDEFIAPELPVVLKPKKPPDANVSLPVSSDFVLVIQVTPTVKVVNTVYSPSPCTSGKSIFTFVDRSTVIASEVIITPETLPY